MRFLDRAKRGVALRWLATMGLLLVLACHPPREARRFDPPAVVPDAGFNRLFVAPGPGWTGGDGTVSVQLPDGRTLWLFGDSFLGRIDPDGTRSADTPFIRNCALIQSPGGLTPLYGQRQGAPAALFQTATRDEWYWPGDATLQAGRLLVFLHRFRSTGPGLWDWQWIGTDIAVLGLPGLGVEAIRPQPVATRTRFGAALLEHQGQVYIFGVTDAAGPRRLHVARAAAGSLLDPDWVFFDGRRWSPAPGRSAGVLTGVGSQFSVVPFRKGFVLITMDGRTPFSGRLVAYTASRPEGPFEGPIALFTAPEAGGDIAAYNPFVHPQFTQQNRILVSYNVNHLKDPTVLYRDAHLYRPRFIRVDLARGLPAASPVEHEFGGHWGWGTGRSGRR